MDKCILEYINNFSNIYQQQIVPQLKNLENERIIAKKNAEKYSDRCFIILVPITLIILFFVTIPLYISIALISSGKMGAVLPGLIMLFIFLVPLVMITFFAINLVKSQFTMQKRNLEQSIKTKIMDKIMPAFGDFKWIQEDIIDKELIADSKITPCFNNIMTDDIFCGTYKNLKICLSETLLLNLESDTDIKDSFKDYNDSSNFFNISKEAYIKTFKDMFSQKYLKHYVFNGVILSVQILKKITGHTIIVPANHKSISKYSEIKLEDIKFSDQFKVYSTDQIEARYILTPSVMERIKNIQNKFSGDSISCSFKDNNLLIAIPTDKDLFSLGNLNTQLADIKQYKTFLEELISIFEIIEELKLYDNTGL